MKTKFQIQKLIDTELKVLETEAVTKRGRMTINKRIEFLKFCLRYLETDPRPEFIESEILRISALVDKINKECAGFKSKISVAKHKALKDFATINKQLKTLNFISCQ